MCGLFWGAHKSLAPRARTLLGGLGQATLSSFAVATLLFVLFGECPKFCDLAKQRRKIVGGVSEVGKDDFSLYFFWRCVIFLVFYFSSAAIARLTPDPGCAVSWATWLLFTGVPTRCVVLCVQCHGPLGSRSPVSPLGVLCCLCGVLGHLAPVHRCARSVCCVVRAVSWATWLLFTGAPAGCVVLRVRCPGPLGSCTPVRPLGVLLCVCGVLGHLAPVHRCAGSPCCFACAVSWASRLLFTGVLARCVVLCVRCPRLLGPCSPVRPLRPLLCLCGVLGHLAPVHRCARLVCCFACAVSWATWLLFTGVPARCVVLRVRCPGPLGYCSSVCPLGVLCRVCGVLGHLAPVHRCARSVCCFAWAVSWATWLLFTGAPARWVVLRVRCPGLLGSCSPVCPLSGLCCVYGVLGRLALVHRCARSVCCALGYACGVACAGRRCGALTPPSGRRLLVAGRGCVPSRRALVHPDGGCW